MNSSLIVKLNFLLLGLGLTIYFIYGLNAKGLSPGVLALFGIAPAQTVGSLTESTWTWCDTRVTALIRPDEKFKLSQEGSRWVVEDQSPREVNFIAVEKWFAKFCSVPAKSIEANAGEGFRPSMMVKFVNGQVEVLRQNDDGVFLWKGQAFAAPQMLEALEELTQL